MTGTSLGSDQKDTKALANPATQARFIAAWVVWTTGNPTNSEDKNNYYDKFKASRTLGRSDGTDILTSQEAGAFLDIVNHDKYKDHFEAIRAAWRTIIQGVYPDPPCPESSIIDCISKCK